MKSAPREPAMRQAMRFTFAAILRSIAKTGKDPGDVARELVDEPLGTTMVTIDRIFATALEHVGGPLEQQLEEAIDAALAGRNRD